MLGEIFLFCLYSSLLNFEAIIVFDFNLSSSQLNLVKNLLEFAINYFQIFRSFHLHLMRYLLSRLCVLLSLVRHVFKLLSNLLSFLSLNIYTLFFPYEMMTRMIYNAIDTYQPHARITEMLHQFFRMVGAKV